MSRPSSPSSYRPTLVMGARGSVGSLVLDALLERGVPVRASARRPAPGAFPEGVEVLAADLTDPASLTTAFHGVGAVFLYARREGVAGVVDAARTAGVSTVVLLSSGSVLRPTLRGNAITEDHRAVEDAFAAAPGLTLVPVRPFVLAANALAWSRSVRAGGPVALYRPGAMTAPVHERDIAAVVVAALTGTASASVSGLLTGPVRISQRDQVGIVAAATGQSVAVTELDRDAALAGLTRLMPAVEAEAVLQFIEDAGAGHSPATTTVADVLGRPATPFETWASDHADDFRRP